MIGSGDLWTGEDARRMVERTGCDGLMVARGGLGRPWVYREMDRALAGTVEPHPEPLAQRVDALAIHAREMFEWFGEREAALRMRKVSCWYLRDFPLANRVRQVFQKFTSRGQYENLLAVVRAHVREGIQLEPALSSLA